MTIQLPTGTGLGILLLLLLLALSDPVERLYKRWKRRARRDAKDEPPGLTLLRTRAFYADALKAAEPDEWGALWFDFETKRWLAVYLPAYPMEIGNHGEPTAVEWLMINDYRKIMEQVHHYKYWDLRTLKWVYWNWATKEWE